MYAKSSFSRKARMANIRLTCEPAPRSGLAWFVRALHGRKAQTMTKGESG